MWLKSQTGDPILYCKRPIWRVGVWPKWVGPAHSTLGQSTPYTSRLTYSKMNHFCPVVLKWHTFVFLSSQLWLILLLSGWRVKYKCVPFLNYWTKIAHFWICYPWSVYNWLTKWVVGRANPHGLYIYPQNYSITPLKSKTAVTFAWDCINDLLLTGFLPNSSKMVLNWKTW